MSCVYTHTKIYICKYTYIHVYTYPRWWVWERGSKDTVRDDPLGPSDRKQTIRKRFSEQGSKVAVRDDPPGPNDRKQTIRKRFHDFRVRVVQSRKKQTILQTNINISAIDFRIVSTHANKSRNDIRIVTSSIMLARNSRPQLPIREDKDVFVLLDVYQLLFNFEGDA